MEVHELKIWPAYFDDVLNGIKTFELRKDDRNIRSPCKLILKEWDPKIEGYTGRECTKLVTYTLREAGHFGLREGWVILALR